MSHKNWLALMFLLLVVQLLCIGFAYFQFATRYPGEFFARLPNGENTVLQPLERPSVSNKALLNWITLAATATFSFDFVNYKEQLQALRDYFTAVGYENFKASLENSGILATIEQKKLVMSSVDVGPAILYTEEETDKNHTWRVQVPILVRYQSADVNETRQHIVDVLVTQVPTQEAPKGIGIAQYIALETSTETSS